MDRAIDTNPEYNVVNNYNDYDVYRERVAAELIMTELQYQRHSVELPTTAPIKIKSFTLPTQP